MAQRYPEARRGRCGARWRGGAVGKKKMTGGAQVSAGRREKTLRMEGVKSRRKRISQNTPRTRVGRAAMRPVGRGRGGSAAWAGRQAKAGWGGAGGMAGPAEG
jgi:hypothetical protein